MGAIQTIRNRRNRVTGLAAWWSVAAAICFALLPILHAPAMAAAGTDAPDGYLVVCTPDGAALVTADPGLPPSDTSAPMQGSGCDHCCPAPVTQVADAAGTPARFEYVNRPQPIVTASARAAFPGARPFSRGPPAA